MFRFDEGSIKLPEGWHDRTVNLLSSNLTGVGPTVSITRDDMPWGMLLDEYIETQCKRLSYSLDSFELLDRRDLKVDRLPAIEMECRWVSEHGKVHQLITSVQDNLKIMAITTSVPDPMSDDQKTEFRNMVATVRFGRKRR